MKRISNPSQSGRLSMRCRHDVMSTIGQMIDNKKPMTAHPKVIVRIKTTIRDFRTGFGLAISNGERPDQSEPQVPE